MVSRVSKGLADCQEDLNSMSQRLPLPAPLALEILELTESLQLSVQFHRKDPDLDLLRVAFTTITA